MRSGLRRNYSRGFHPWGSTNVWATGTKRDTFIANSIRQLTHYDSLVLRRYPVRSACKFTCLLYVLNLVPWDLENNETIKKKKNLKRGSIKQEWRRQLHTYKSKSRHAIVSTPLINNGQKKKEELDRHLSNIWAVKSNIAQQFPVIQSTHQVERKRGRGYSAVTIQRIREGKK